MFVSVGADNRVDRSRLTSRYCTGSRKLSAYFELTSSAARTLRPYPVMAQFAGGRPAICDGVTQPGLKLSLFSHNIFDAAVYLGICDQIAPGLLIGTLCFGHLPPVLIAGRPMTTGTPNSEQEAEPASCTGRGRPAAAKVT